MWQRRAFLRAAGAGFAAALLPRQVEALERTDLVFASAIQRKGGGYAAALLTETGELVSSIDLPDRGHDITWSRSTGQAVVFARQPGTFAVAFDVSGKAPPRTLTSSEGRHFYGHGAFSPDGRLLYATENDFEQARGVVGLFDATDGYRRVGEFDTFGTGPHDMLLTPDGTTLVIANGGIETHPDFGRAELNLESMDPSISFVDVRTGERIGQLRLDAGLHQLSIRHMTFDQSGRVWFGCQFRGADALTPQLLGYATREGKIGLVELPPEVLGALRNYVGSVAASADGSRIAASSPEGDVVLVLDAMTTHVLGTTGLEDGCGIAPDGAGFVASSGQGALTGVDIARAERRYDFGFDNHLRRLS